MMPLSLGDAEKSFLTVSQTQYFLLGQWHAKAYAQGPGPALGPGEKLDRITLENCLGGRYSPGIEVSFPVRDVNLYIQDWQKQDCGPFRINQAPLDYSKAIADKPFLTFGYIPLQKLAVEPGDISKFMSVPWFTDYNSCATHLPDPNPQGNNTLFWSWPAERPVAVYPVSLCHYDAKIKDLDGRPAGLCGARARDRNPLSGAGRTLPEISGFRRQLVQGGLRDRGAADQGAVRQGAVSGEHLPRGGEPVRRRPRLRAALAAGGRAALSRDATRKRTLESD